MSLDNVLAISGAAHGDMVLVVFGVGLSIPIVIWGSGLLARLMARFWWIVDVGAAILGWVAGEMILGDRVVQGWLGGHPTGVATRAVQVALAHLVIVIGRVWARRRRGARWSRCAPDPATESARSPMARRRSDVEWPSLEPVRSTRIYEEIVRQIRLLIADGHLKSGDRLPPERDLAERFRVSRTSVREAMRALESRGLIGIRAGGGRLRPGGLGRGPRRAARPRDPGAARDDRGPLRGAGVSWSRRSPGWPLAGPAPRRSRT